MCAICGNQRCIPNCSLPCGHIYTLACLNKPPRKQCPECAKKFVKRDVWPLYSGVQADDVDSAATDNLPLSSSVICDKLASAKNACSLLRRFVRLKRQRQPDSDPIIATHIMPLKTQEDDTIKVFAALPVRSATRFLLPSAPAIPMQFWGADMFTVESSLAVQPLSVKFDDEFMTHGFHARREGIELSNRVERFVIEWPTDANVRECRFERSPDQLNSNIPLICATVPGGLYRVNIQDRRLETLFEYLVPTRADIVNTTIVSQHVVVICGELCVWTTVFKDNDSQARLYHVAAVKYDMDSAAEILNVVGGCLGDCCPHHITDPHDRKPIPKNNAHVDASSWQPRWLHFEQPRRIELQIQHGDDDDVIETQVEVHKDLLCLRESARCLSVKTNDGNTIGAVHTAEDIVDFVWQEEDASRIADGDFSLFCCVVVLTVDGQVTRWKLSV